MKQPKKLKRVVFFLASGVIGWFVFLALLLPQAMEVTLLTIQSLIISEFGWLYILAVAFFLVISITFFISPLGRLRLGKAEDTPQYGYWTWLALIFSVGMGIGWVYFGVAEPLLHFYSPLRDAPGTIAAAESAIVTSYLHWGLHAWSIYAVTGLAIAFFAYRYDLPLNVSTALYPLIGKGIKGSLGSVVDILSIFSTVFGVATSIGFSAIALNAGLAHLQLVPQSVGVQLIFIGIISLLFTGSALTGLDYGILRLSQFKLLLAVVMILYVFLCGPTQFLTKAIIQDTGLYLQDLPSLSLHTNAYGDPYWMQNWTMFYWGWWISWAPFVGIFIARVSRGRTIREFIGGVLIIPTLLNLFWFGVFGNVAIYLDLFKSAGLGLTVSDNVPAAFYSLLDHLPGTHLLNALGTLTLVIFIIASADKAVMSLSMLSRDGDLHPPGSIRLWWGLVLGAVAAALLVAGGLIALQTAAIMTAFPFSLIMLLITYGLLLTLWQTTADPIASPPAKNGERSRQ